MKILYTTDQVNKRIDEIAQELITRYPHDRPLFVCLLKGAVPFTSKLMMAITEHSPAFHPEVEYMHVSAYGEEREAGIAQVRTDLDAQIVNGRQVIIVDDCLDKGVTYVRTKELLLGKGAASVGLVVLADKAVPRDTESPLITGFKTPNVWLVGMGMDDSASAPEAERWASYVGDVSSN